MTIVDDDAAMGRAMTSATDPHVRRLLQLRRAQLGDGWPDAARFLLAGTGDTAADAEAAVGFPLRQGGEPTCEWAALHDGLIEMAWTLSDDGPSQVLVVPLRAGVGPDLLEFAREAVEAAQVTGEQA